MNNEKNRFEIAQVYICPFIKKDNMYRPDTSYPTKYCVIDNETNTAIDIENNLKYSYVDLIDLNKYTENSYKIASTGNRVAVFPLYNKLNDLSGDSLSKIMDIESKLLSGFKFEDGNEAILNDIYLQINNNKHR